jgi:hypothetical protein
MKKYPKVITLKYLEALVAEQEKKDLIAKIKNLNNIGNDGETKNISINTIRQER